MGIKTLGLTLIAALLTFLPGAARAAELPPTGELLQRVSKLQQSIAALEETGQINFGRATSLSQKLERVNTALRAREATDATEDVVAQQERSFLGEIRQAIEALLEFIRELTQLVTELPAEVLQPIIDAAISLLQDLLALLLG